MEINLAPGLRREWGTPDLPVAHQAPGQPAANHPEQVQHLPDAQLVHKGRREGQPPVLEVSDSLVCQAVISRGRQQVGGVGNQV